MSRFLLFVAMFGSAAATSLEALRGGVGGTAATLFTRLPLVSLPLISIVVIARFAQASKEKVAIIGSGNWGSAIAKIVGRNVLDRDEFENDVHMWVYEEQVDGKNLTEIINTEHENVKYLPVCT